MDDMKVFNSILFPPVFKWIGFAVAAVGLALACIMKEEYLWVPVILGLWVAMWSRERRDDEMMRQVRLVAAFLAFAWTALWIVICRAVSFDMLAESTVFSMLLFYHLHMCVFRLKARRENAAKN